MVPSNVNEKQQLRTHLLKTNVLESLSNLDGLLWALQDVTVLMVRPQHPPP